MTEHQPRSDQAADLRRQAEKRAAPLPEDPAARSPEETRRTLHELRVHQIELEMQNEELRRAQAELDALRARYFDLYDLAPVGYFSLSEHGLILQANLAGADFLGVPRTALVKQPLSRFILPEDQDIYYQHHRQLVKTGDPQNCELRIKRADAAIVWARLETTAIQDSDSGRPLLLTVVSNITERKQAEEQHQALLTAVQQEKMRLSALIDGIADEIWFADPHHTFILANPSAIREFGLAQNVTIDIEKLAQSLEVLRPDGTPRPVEKAPPLRALLGEVVRNEEEIVRTPASGELRYRQVSSTPVRDPSGRILGSVSVVRDITDFKRAESRVQHLNEVLRAIRDIGQLIVRERNANTLLAEACRTLVRTRGYQLVWIGGVVPDSNRVQPMASAGSAADDLNAMTITWDDNVLGRGPIGTALRERRVCVCEDTATDPDFAPWREPALACGHRSLAAAPLIHGDRLFGAVVVYADRPAAFDNEVVRLLSELAADLAFALQAIEGE